MVGGMDVMNRRYTVADLYRQIFRLLIANGQITNVDRLAEREVAAALESVFPQAGLNVFTIMPEQDKRKQVADMIDIVLGIRLFNKDIKKGGAGIEDGTPRAVWIALHV